MADLTQSELSNLFVRAMRANEADGDKALVLSEAGIEGTNWWATQFVRNSLTYHGQTVTPNSASGFSIGVMQLDFSNGDSKITGNLANAIATEAVATGQLTSSQAADLKNALLTFKARNLEGKSTSTSAYDPTLQARAIQEFTTVMKDRQVVENLIQNDSVVQDALTDAVARYTDKDLVGAQAGIKNVTSYLSGQSQQSSLLTDNYDQMLTTFADFYNQVGNTNSLQAWLEANPNATWQDYATWDATSSVRKGGQLTGRPQAVSRDQNIAQLYSNLAGGIVSADSDPYSGSGAVIDRDYRNRVYAARGFGWWPPNHRLSEIRAVRVLRQKLRVE